MRALVTGGAGFIGSHIVERLLADGHEVRVVDDFSSGFRRNLAPVAAEIELWEGDVRDLSLMQRASQGRDWVFHEAALVSVPRSVEQPQLSHDINIQGTLNVLLAARDAGVQRLVFASSAAIYGFEPTQPKHEGMLPEPASPYGVDKITGEHYLRTFNQLYGLETVALRYFNVFGPRQDPGSAYSGVISIFVDRTLAGEGVTIYGDGEQYRDFVSVHNVVDANLLAATRPEAPGRCYNVGCGHKTSLNDLRRLLARLSGSELPVSHGPPRAGDIRESLADIRRLQRELGYQPRIGVEQGLAQLLAFERRARAG